LPSGRPSGRLRTLNVLHARRLAPPLIGTASPHLKGHALAAISSGWYVTPPRPGEPPLRALRGAFPPRIVDKPRLTDAPSTDWWMPRDRLTPCPRTATSCQSSVLSPPSPSRSPLHLCLSMVWPDFVEPSGRGDYSGLLPEERVLCGCFHGQLTAGNIGSQSAFVTGAVMYLITRAAG